MPKINSTKEQNFITLTPSQLTETRIMIEAMAAGIPPVCIDDESFRNVVVDDLIATGGTLKACINLVEQLGGKVERLVLLMELSDLHGRDALKGYDVKSVIQYEGK